MSINHSQQDIHEQRCLDFVKENIIDNEHFDVSDTQLRELRMWLNEAVPNPNRNDFPDFIFNNGFIEHFAVTSSLENKKGSHQKKESKIFEEKSKKNFLYNLEKNGSDVSPGNPYIKKMEEHSHDYLVSSIKKNWTKHIRSYEKNSSNKGIFLVEYTDTMIETAIIKENKLEAVYDTYRISGDRNILNWIYEDRDKISYLMFINFYSQAIEIIRLDNIPNIIKKYPKAVHHSSFAFESHNFLNIKL